MGSAGGFIPSLDPVSLAITAATTILKSKFENDAAKENERAQVNAQRIFNEDIQNRRNSANVQFQDSIQKSGQEVDATRYDDAKATRTADYQPSFNQDSLLPGQGNASRAVRTAIVNSQNRAKDQNQDAANAFAALGAYEDSALGRDIALRQNANRIATQGGFAQGALNNLKTDMDAAKTAGSGKMQIADLIGGAGSLAGAAYGSYNPTKGQTLVTSPNTYGPVKPYKSTGGWSF